MKTRTCKQCGELKPIEQYRSYYGGRKGHYTTCLACEKINSRAKYIMKKSTRTDKDEEELEKILELYKVQREVGLRPPNFGAAKKVKVVDTIDDMLSKYTAKVDELKKIKQEDSIEDIPSELGRWLTETLTDEPDVYWEVYDKLREKFAPVLRIDKETTLPVRDDNYKSLLDRIAARFGDYEDNYYEEAKQ